MSDIRIQAISAKYSKSIWNALLLNMLTERNKSCFQRLQIKSIKKSVWWLALSCSFILYSFFRIRSLSKVFFCVSQTAFILAAILPAASPVNAHTVHFLESVQKSYKEQASMPFLFEHLVTLLSNVILHLFGL